MKKILLAQFFVAFFTCAFSQQGLKYSQTLTFFGTAGQGVTYTVPAGKTWKIESGHCNTLESNTKGYLRVNDFEIGLWLRGNGYIVEPNFPIWLKAGDVLSVAEDYAPSPRDYFLSILEFDIQ